MLHALTVSAMQQHVTIPEAQPIARSAQDTPKSRRTRLRILDSAMTLFAGIGYHEAVNLKIAGAAGITRGAMLYHFPTREDLIGAAIDHIQALRMRRLAEVSAGQPFGADPTAYAIDAYWGLLSEVPFVAFAELQAVARTDAMVRARIAPAETAFDHAQIGEQPLAHGGAAARLQASRDLARFLLEGMKRAEMTHDAPERTERLLTVIKRTAQMLNRKGAAADLWPE